MAKKTVKKEDGKVPLHVAAALYLELETERCTARQCLTMMLTRVRVIVNDPALTLQQLKNAISHWLTEGWAMISGNTIQVMRAGRAKIKQLADEGTMAPQPA